MDPMTIQKDGLYVIHVSATPVLSICVHGNTVASQEQRMVVQAQEPLRAGDVVAVDGPNLGRFFVTYVGEIPEGWDEDGD